MPPWISLLRLLPFPLFPSTACAEIDRPSWQTGSHPHGLTPITLTAASCVPLVPIGAPWADSMSARTTTSPLQMPDIRLHAFPYGQNYQSISWRFGGVHIRSVRTDRAREHQHVCSCGERPKAAQGSKRVFCPMRWARGPVTTGRSRVFLRTELASCSVMHRSTPREAM